MALHRQARPQQSKKKRPLIIITAPHATLNPADAHPYDWAARDIATDLAERLKALLFLADRQRDTGDLNRPETRDTDWRQRVLESARPGTYLFDIHSYPGDEPGWGAYDFILLRSHGAADGPMLKDIPTYLTQRGYKAAVRDSDVINDIVETGARQGARAILIEVNEGTYGRLGADKIAADLAGALKSII